MLEILHEKGIHYTIERIKSSYELENEPVVKRYIETLEMKKYSKNTINAYVPFFKVFVSGFPGRNIEELKYSEIMDYVEKYRAKKQLSGEQSKQLDCSIKFFYEKVCGREKLFLPYEIRRIIEKTNPIFSFNELEPHLREIEKMSEKLLLLFVYCKGMSFEETCNLTLTGLKDKLDKQGETNLYLKSIAKDYYLQCKPRKYVFEKGDGIPYTPEEIANTVYELISKYQIMCIYKKLYKIHTDQTDFSENTRYNYLSCFLSFLKYYNFRHPSLITNDEIKAFLLQLARDTRKSESTQNQYINTLKFYYMDIEKRNIPSDIFIRPKKTVTLPKYLNKNEIEAIVESVSYKKHRLMLCLLYSTGVRRSELLGIRLADIDFKRNEIFIFGKGKKERINYLAHNIISLFNEYLDEFKPREYLFEGRNGKYSGSSLYNVLKEAVRKAGIKRNVTLHMMRHSYATHLLEAGVDISYIQALLGHKDIKTTQRYAKVVNKELKKIVNPFDQLNIKKDTKNGNQIRSP